MMFDNPLLGLLGFSGPVDNNQLLGIASGDWPPRWWKRIMGQDDTPSGTLPTAVVHGPRTAPNPQAVLDRLGYLPQQRSGNYNLDLSTKAYNSVDPYGGDYYRMNPQHRLQRALDIFQSGQQRPINVYEKASEDAWAMYLGLPQKYRSFEVSPHKPSIATNPNQVYLRIPSLWNTIGNGALAESGPNRTLSIRVPAVTQPTAGGPNTMSSQGIARVLQFLGDKNRRVISGDALDIGGDIRPGTALADFTISRGQDAKGHYLSYYDIWDLDAPGAGTKLGRSFEVYDRLYYDPRTLQPISQ